MTPNTDFDKLASWILSSCGSFKKSPHRFILDEPAAEPWDLSYKRGRAEAVHDAGDDAVDVILFG